MGVKDLWQLLSPIGRRVSIETLEGKVTTRTMMTRPEIACDYRCVYFDPYPIVLLFDVG
jgi:hypothetical protein